MTLEQFKEWLEKENWKITKDSFALNENCDWYAYKYFEDFQDCFCNDKPPPVSIHPAVVKLDSGQSFYACEFSVRGETKLKEWVDFKYYSVNFDQAKKKCHKFIYDLKTAWNSVA